MRDERKEFKVRLTEEEWEEVRKALFDRKIKQQAAGHAALFAWIRSAPPVPNPEQPSPPVPIPKQPPRDKHAEWHELLDAILDHGTTEDVVGIQANLRWGAEAVRRRRDPPPRRKAM